MWLLLAVSLCPSLLAQCTTAICDSFDNYTGTIIDRRGYGPNNLTASVSNTAGSPINAEIDTSMYYSKPGSLHITVTAANQTGALLNYNPVQPWPVIFGRAMVYFSNASTNRVPNNVHSWIFSANGLNDYYSHHNATNATSPNGAVSMNIIVGTGTNKIALNYHWGPLEQSTTSSARFEANRWFCLQWNYDGPKSGAKVWVDGALFINVTHDNNFTAYNPTGSSSWRFADYPGWSRLQFGFQHYQTLAAPVDLHLDDYVLDTQMTCCPCDAGVTAPHCCVNPTVAPTPMGTNNGTNNSTNPSQVADGSSGFVCSASAFLMLALIFVL